MGVITMAKQTFRITDEASMLLRQNYESQKRTSKKITYDEIVSEAIKRYCLEQNKDRAERIFEVVVQDKLQRFESRMIALLAQVGIDVDMILFEILEQRMSLEDNLQKTPREVYEELRQEGVALFRRKKAFQIPEASMDEVGIR